MTDKITPEQAYEFLRTANSQYISTPANPAGRMIQGPEVLQFFKERENRMLVLAEAVARAVSGEPIIPPKA